MSRRLSGRGRRGAPIRRTPALRIRPRRPEAQQQRRSPPEAAPPTPDARPAPASNPLETVRAVQPVELLEIEQVSPAGVQPAIDTGPILTEELSFEEYIEKIEAAAARLRAEQRRQRQAPRAQAAAGVRPRPGQARRRAKPKPLLKRRKTWFIIAALIPLILATVATLYALNIVRLGIGAYRDIHEDPVDRVRYRVNPEGTPEPVPADAVGSVLPNWDEDDPVNILLLGVDARANDDQPPRSDTAIVVHIDPRSERVTMMSIPRDLLVYIPEFGEDKFNAAYPLGEANEGEIEGGGPTLVAQTVEANFNIHIHYYATIDFAGFEKVVDTVGGVVVDVDTHLSDNQYPTEDLRLTRVYFPTGLQKLDGKRALEYVRTRHADNDLKRAERQQQVLMAIREQAISLDLITRAPDLIEDLSDTVRTDLDFNQMLALANLGRRIDQEEIVRFNLWEEGLLTERNDPDGYYLEADWTALRERAAAYFGETVAGTASVSSDGEPTPDEEQPEPNFDIPIFVENATDIPMLAGNSSQLLVDAGFTAVWPGDARRLSERTVIENHTGDAATAVYVAEVLGLPAKAIVDVPNGEGITVILGEDVPDSLIPEAPQTAS